MSHCMLMVFIMSDMLQRVAVCCSVLQCVAVCCSVLQCVAVCCSVTQCVCMRVRVYMMVRSQDKRNLTAECSFAMTPLEIGMV